MEILNRLSRKAPPKVREDAMQQVFGGRAFQEEGPGSAKALRWKQCKQGRTVGHEIGEVSGLFTGSPVCSAENTVKRARAESR